MTDSWWPRKHVRLESFLTKLLAAEATRVMCYEPCILEADSAKKPSYTYVVLTDGHVYFIDSPPKQVRDVISLNDIVDIRVVHESPMFLKEEDRERVQNIQISCKSRSKSYIPGTFSVISSKATSRSLSVLSEAFTTPSDMSPTKESERKHRKLRKFLMSISWPNRKTIVHKLGFTDKHSASSQSLFHTSSRSNSITEDDNVTPNMPGNRSEVCSQPSDTDTLILDPVLGTLEFDSTPNPQEASRSFRGIQATDWLSLKRPASVIPDNNRMDTTSLSSCSSDMAELTVRSEPIFRSRTVLGNYGDHWSRPTSATFSDTSEFVQEESPDDNMYGEVMNLYILKPRSGFYKYLSGAWTNCLLKHTLELGDRRNIARKALSPDNAEHMLQELRRKLCMNSENNAAQIRNLSDSIHRNLMKYPSMKRIFWKDPHLFPSLVNKLHTLISSPNTLEQHDIGYVMDKIKACSSLIHVLACALEESVRCPGRPKHLTQRSGQRTKNLLTVLVTMPWIPPNDRESTTLIATSYDRFSTREWETLLEAPLIRSVAELTNASTMVLYQYFQLALEGHELMSYQIKFGIGWMMKIISESKSFDTFISRLMCQVLLLTNSNDNCPLQPAQAVLLHQQISVLSTFVSSSPHLALRIAIMYGEDIRYFILRQVIEKKVLPHYPIRQSLLNSVDILRQAILQKRSAVSTATRLISLDRPRWFEK